MKILITGARGQLGSECARVLGNRYEVRCAGSRDVDICDAAMVNEAVGRFRPDILLNCAAFTRVDDCETQHERAWKINVEGAANLAGAVAACGGRIVHISTDYVFDGTRQLPHAYREADPTHPLSYYGKTKVASERVVRQATDNHLIIRTGWLYGARGRNFLKAALAAVRRRPSQPLKVVNDQHGSPTWAYRLACQIERCIADDLRGTWHASAEGHCTWYDLARAFFEKMNVHCTVLPCTSSEYQALASRPLNSILSHEKLKQTGAFIMKPWLDDLELFVRGARGQAAL